MKNINCIIKKFETEEEWLEYRKGKITGTRLKDLILKRSTEPKIGFYSIIAERIAVPPTQENPMDRGKRLEEQAIEEFEKETGKKVNKDLVIWQRKDNEYIAYSPDGYIGKTEAVEVKCLSSALHIKAWLTQKIPNEYEYQVIQPFIVNEKLKKLYFVFYDPRMPKDLFWLEVERKDIKDKIEECLELEKNILKDINKIEKELTF
jgi:predicted phage-related endonuclease